MAGQDGLKFIRQLIGQAEHFLKPGGFLAMEIGAYQAEEVARLLRSGWSQTEIVPDYSGFPRVVCARKMSD